jgi:cytochrome c oxidase assembly protein subunit 15
LKQKQWLRYVLNLAIILALVVVSLGAYTRLTNAGLGCPDWPGCYGQLRLPAEGKGRVVAQALYPNQQIDSTKAWTEMVHRYVAGFLVCLVLLSLGLAIGSRRHKGSISLKFPLFLVAWIVFQALLGMWTVTWRLLPIVVMAHLLSGAILFCGLVIFRVHVSQTAFKRLPAWRPWMGLGLLIVFFQMALGGWVSANYAGIACEGFPTCNGAWWPVHWSSLKMALHVLNGPIGMNYQGGVLQHEVRVVIQVIHRWGALITALYTLSFIGVLWMNVKDGFWRAMGGWLLILLAAQILLGVINVLYYLPLPVAVLHNVVAVLLFSTWGVMRYAS